MLSATLAGRDAATDCGRGEGRKGDAAGSRVMLGPVGGVVGWVRVASEFAAEATPQGGALAFAPLEGAAAGVLSGSPTGVEADGLQDAVTVVADPGQSDKIPLVVVAALGTEAAAGELEYREERVVGASRAPFEGPDRRFGSWGRCARGAL